MKKLIVLLLMSALTLGCVACGRGNNDDTQNQSGTENHTGTEGDKNTEADTNSKVELPITDANEILTKVWETYESGEKFSAVGGHYNNSKTDAPGKYDITKVEDLESAFCIPAESIALIDDAATLQHGMNANTFSAAAYHLKDSADMQTVIDDIKNMTMNNQWLCGFPERLIIVTVGDEYLVTAFGHADIISNFESKLLGLYDGVPELVVDEDL